MRDDFGRWVVFGVLVCFLGGILFSHWKKQERKPVEAKKETTQLPKRVELKKKPIAPVVKKSPTVPIKKTEVVEKNVQKRVEKVEQEVNLDRFYPNDPQTLKKNIASLLKKAPNKKYQGKLLGLITPHAGMEYSGKIAATAFKQLKGKSYDTVVLIVPNHESANLNGIVISPSGKWTTPLGSVEVDAELADRLREESSEFEFSIKPFEQEHAVDVQLPFLQATLKDFKVLPIMMGGRSTERAIRLADALGRTTRDKKVLYLATTHFSKGELYATAKKIDFLAISALEQCDISTLRKYENEEVIQMCGYAPVLTLLYLMQDQRVEKGKLLENTNSADVTGKKDETIVGYAAMAFYKEEKKK